MNDDAWLRFRHGSPLPPREEEDLATALRDEPSVRKELLADADMDGFLRGLAWADANADVFVSAVAASLDGDARFVKRVREALDRTPPARPTRRRKLRARLRGSRPPALRWIPWAAVALVAILLALRSGAPRTPEPVAVQPPAPLTKEPGSFVRPTPAPAPEPAPEPTVEPVETPVPPAPQPSPQPPAPPVLPAPTPEPPPRPPVRATVAEVLKIDRLHGTALVLPEDGAPKPAVAGAGLPSGAGFRVTDGRAALAFPDGTRIEIHGPAELRTVQDGRDGKRLALRRGVITLDVAKQAPGAPLVVDTAQARAVVLGTTLRVFAEPEATRVEVRTGRVRLEAEGRSLELEAGHFAVATPGASFERRPLATIVPLAPGRPSAILADFENGLPGHWEWAVERGVAERPVLNHDRGGPGGSGALRVDSRAPGRGETSATQVYRTPADWSARRGIRLAFEGSGSGQPVRFEILDDAAERFAYVWIDDAPGWRLIEIPWGAFLRRGSGQPRGARDDGLTRTAVQGWALSAPESRAEFRVDDVGLLR